MSIWEIILFVTMIFWATQEIRKIIDCKATLRQQMGKPELMWFDEKTARWNRVTHMHLLVADRVVVEIPVKLVEKR